MLVLSLLGLLALALSAALSACAVGPDYIPEAAPVPHTFKEMKGWKFATPIDQLDRGDWWGFYHDPKLAFLLKQVEISNQTVAAQAAAYEQARALIREAQAALFPTLSAGQPPASAGAAAASDNRPAKIADWAARARLRFDVDMTFSP